MLAGVAAAATVALGVPLTMLATAPPALACSCAMSAFAEQVERSDVVFAGTVTGEGDEPGGEIVSSADLVGWPFQVDAVHKGTAAAQQTVHSELSSASCGFGFAVGRTYLVLATVEGDTLRTSLCSGTAELTDVPVADIESLGPGVVPAAAERPAADDTGPGAGGAAPNGSAGDGDGAADAEALQPGASDDGSGTVVLALVATGVAVAGVVAATIAIRRRRGTS